jgi:hypothetical protein
MSATGDGSKATIAEKIKFLTGSSSLAVNLDNEIII